MNSQKMAVLSGYAATCVGGLFFIDPLSGGIKVNEYFGG